MSPIELQEIYEAWGIAGEHARLLSQLGDRAAARHLFQIGLWDAVVDEACVEGEFAWIESWLRDARLRGQPQRGTAAAIERLLSSGADPRDLTAVVRAMQVELVHAVCDVLDGEGFEHYDEAAPHHPTCGWRLFEIDADNRPIQVIESLHEDVDDLDPLNPDGVRALESLEDR